MHTLAASFREKILAEAKGLSETARLVPLGDGYWIGLDEEVEGYRRDTCLEDGQGRTIYLFTKSEQEKSVQKRRAR